MNLRRGILAGGIVCAVACGAVVRAQEKGTSGKYARQGEVEQLEKILAAELEKSDPPQSAPKPARLIELSRLLAEPGDQVNWVVEKTQEYATGEVWNAEEVSEALRSLRERVRGFSVWGGPDADVDGWEQRIVAIGEALRPASTDCVDLSKPAEIAACIADASPEVRAEWSAADRFRLYARGVSAEVLELDGREKPEWHGPAGVVELVAHDGLLPGMFSLLKEREDFLRDFSTDGLDVGTAALAQDTKDIALAFLNLTMGAERDAALGTVNWESRAERLAQEDLWLWSALSHILAATEPAQRPTHLAQGKAEWAKYVESGGSEYAGVTSWLDRLGRGSDALTALDQLPLDISARDACLNIRAAIENEIQRLVGQWSTTRSEALAGDILELIQLAKASYFGVVERADNAWSIKEDHAQAFQSASLADVRQAFTYEPRSRGSKLAGIHLFLEVLCVGGNGGDPSWVGVALFGKTGTFQEVVGEPDEWQSPLVLRGATLEDIVSSAVQRVSFEVAGRVVFATDRGAIPSNEKALVDKIVAGEDKSWLIYLPTVNAAFKSGWNIDRTLRYWMPEVIRGSDDGVTPIYPPPFRRGTKPFMFPNQAPVQIAALDRLEYHPMRVGESWPSDRSLGLSSLYGQGALQVLMSARKGHFMETEGIIVVGVPK